MLFSELAKRVAEKYPEVKTAYPMDCELSNVELYDPSGAVPPVDSLSIYTARQISQDMTLPLCFVCAGTPDQAAHDKIAYSDSNYIIIPQVSVVDVVYYIMSLFGDSFKQQKLYSNLIYMLLNGADLTSVFCEFPKAPAHSCWPSTFPARCWPIPSRSWSTTRTGSTASRSAIWITT